MAQDKDWWRGTETYQIHPQSFQDSDGDGIGDLPGVTSPPDHVASLGANATAAWYVWPDAMPDGTPPNTWLSHFVGPARTWARTGARTWARTLDSRRKQVSMHNFLTNLPGKKVRPLRAVGWE